MIPAPQDRAWAISYAAGYSAGYASCKHTPPPGLTDDERHAWERGHSDGIEDALEEFDRTRGAPRR